MGESHMQSTAKQPGTGKDLQYTRWGEGDGVRLLCSEKTKEHKKYLFWEDLSSSLTKANIHHLYQECFCGRKKHNVKLPDILLWEIF